VVEIVSVHPAGDLAMCAVLPNRVESANLERVSEEEFGKTLWKDGEQVLLSTELPAGDTMECLGSRKDDGLKLIKLRNLRGKVTGIDKGAWDWGPGQAGAQSKWSRRSKLRQYFGYQSMDEATAWIDAADFPKQYNTLLVLHGWDGGDFINMHHLDACPNGQQPCHAHQYLLTFELDPQISSPLSAGGETFANIVPKTAALYDPPDFRALEIGEEDDINSTDSAAAAGPESGEEKRLIVTLFLSQPNMQAFTGKQIWPKNIFLRVFRLQQRRLQAPEQRAADALVEKEGSDEGEGTDAEAAGHDAPADENTVAESPDNGRMEYFWPEYNKVELETLRVTDPAGNPYKDKEFGLLEKKFQFGVTQPGVYSVAIEQEIHTDEIDYCFSVHTEEQSTSNQSGLHDRCEFGGTHVDPQVRPDSKDGKSTSANSHSSFTLASRSRGPSMGDMQSYAERSPSVRSGRQGTMG